MSEPRLKSEIWVKAQIRLCEQAFLPAMVRRKGDADAGAVFLKIDRLDGTAVVLTQVRREGGQAAWMRGTGPEAVSDEAAEAYLARQTKYDSDLWIIEIEDPKGQFVPEGGVVEG